MAEPRHRPQPSRIIGPILFLAFLCTPPSSAQGNIETTKMTDFIATRGAVEDARRSPDGQRIVYRASQDASDVVELYSVPTAGGPVTKLNQPLVPGGDVLDFEISPDSQWVAFLADAVSDAKDELFRVPIDGGTVTQVNANMVPAGDVSGFRFSASSAHLVYTATQRHFRIEELFSHTLATSAVAMLSPMLGVDSVIHDFAISPDEAHVVFTLGDPGGQELFSAPMTGGGATQLGEPPSSPDVVPHFEITSDSLEVVFYRDVSGGEEVLRSVPITGGATTLLSPAGMLVQESFRLTSDDSTAIFVAIFEGPTSELFALDLATGTATSLSGTSNFVTEYFLSPDDSQVVFMGRAVSGPFLYDGLAIAPIGGGSVTALADSPLLGLEELLFTADGSHLVYHYFSGNTPTGVGLLFSVPTDGSSAAVDLAPDVGDRGVRGVALDADDSHVLYRSDRQTDDVFEVFSVPIGGGAPTVISDPLPAGANVDGAFFDGDSVLYRADQDEPGVVELYEVASTGGGSTKINEPMLGTWGQVRSFAMTPDQQRVVFIADQNVAEQFELWSYSLADGGPPIRLSETPFPTSQVLALALAPDGTTVVFSASRDVEDAFGLWAVPAEGGPVTRLDDPADGSLETWQITGDGQYVVYRMRSDGDRVFRVAIDGGDIRLLFEGPFNPRWRLSPDGQHAVYLDGDRLMSIPIGSGAPVTLSPPGLTVANSSTEFRITPDGSTVVLRAFSEANQRNELWSVPIDGGIAVPLSTVAPPCSNNLPGNQEFFFTPDSTRVLMLCGVGLFPDLYIVPITGGPLLRLLDMGPQGRFGTLRVSPDSSYVVVRHDGATSPFRLTGTPTTVEDVQVFFSVPGFDIRRSLGRFIITPDSSSVVFLGDDNEGSREDLYIATLGVAGSTQLNTEGNVNSFALSADSSRIFYTATPLHLDFPAPTSDLVSIPMGGGPIQTYHPTNPDGQIIHRYRVGSDGKSVLYSGEVDADGTADLYFSRDVSLFVDGFESGDTSQWSAAVP